MMMIDERVAPGLVHGSVITTIEVMILNCRKNALTTTYGNISLLKE